MLTDYDRLTGLEPFGAVNAQARILGNCVTDDSVDISSKHWINENAYMPVLHDWVTTTSISIFHKYRVNAHTSLKSREISTIKFMLFLNWKYCKPKRLEVAPLRSLITNTAYRFNPAR